MYKLKSILLGGILVVLAVFLIQNFKTASINFLFWGIDLPRAILFLLIFIIGVIFGAISISIFKQSN